MNSIADERNNYKINQLVNEIHALEAQVEMKRREIEKLLDIPRIAEERQTRIPYIRMETDKNRIRDKMKSHARDSRRVSNVEHYEESSLMVSDASSDEESSLSDVSVKNIPFDFNEFADKLSRYEKAPISKKDKLRTELMAASAGRR